MSHHRIGVQEHKIRYQTYHSSLKERDNLVGDEPSSLQTHKCLHKVPS